jgi:hypothetical protein
MERPTPIKVEQAINRLYPDAGADDDDDDDDDEKH